MNVLVVDVGGNNVKILATGQTQIRKIPSGSEMTPEIMGRDVLAATADWQYDAVSIGFPGPIMHGRLVAEPRNLGHGWVGFDFQALFQRPTKLINDAAMQALGSYQGGQMLFLGLGTGLGAALVVEGVVAPLEIAHLPYRKGRTFEDYVGQRGMEWLGLKKWRRSVEDVVTRLQAAFVCDYVVLGGGNVKELATLPPHCRRGENIRAFLGGFRLWDPNATLPTLEPPVDWGKKTKKNGKAETALNADSSRLANAAAESDDPLTSPTTQATEQAP